MNMKVLIPVAIALAVAAIFLLSNADDVSMGGESHEVAPSTEKK